MAITISNTIITFNDGTSMHTALMFPLGYPTIESVYIGQYTLGPWHLFACKFEYEQTKQWKTTNTAGGSTSTNGFTNSETINLPEYPAAYYCRTTMSGVGGFSDWYLPSLSELGTVLIPNRQYLDGYTNSDHWSSNRNTTTNAYGHSMTDIISRPKTDSLIVRPVRQLKI